MKLFKEFKGVVWPTKKTVFKEYIMILCASAVGMGFILGLNSIANVLLKFLV